VIAMKLIRIHCHTDLNESVTTYNLEIHPELLDLYRELGIIEFAEGCISYADLRRLQKVLRLKDNLGVNTVGASIIVDLLDKIEQLQDEIESLRKGG
jgi:MerR family transcriptional regulator, heat shock protein HspR